MKPDMTAPRFIKFLGLGTFLLLVALASPMGVKKAHAAQADTSAACEKPGWFPSDFGLKDHHVFWYAGYYYLISTYVPPGNTNPLAQDRFVYARSVDFCSWEQLPPVLAERIPGTWDETAVWAPFVYSEGGTYYLYYTGVTNDWTQTILTAVTNNPSDPGSWQVQNVLFQPNHASMLWADGVYSDCRDPFVLKYEGGYFLFYTGRDASGGIIGVATASSPLGPWTDWGSIVAPMPGQMLESPAVVSNANWYYLFYNLAQVGEFYQIGFSPTGPWLEPETFNPGWAHEIWHAQGGSWFTSYLTDYSVTIAPLVWDHSLPIPRPSINWIKTKIYIPLIRV